MVPGTKLRHLEAAGCDPVKVFAAWGKATIRQVQRQVAFGLFGNKLCQLFNVFSKGAAGPPTFLVILPYLLV